jgi:Beta-lactamase
MTVRHVLQHETGLAEYLTADLLLNPLNHYRTYTAEQHLAALSRKPVFAEPGTSFSYSNSNYILAGMLIQKGPRPDPPDHPGPPRPDVTHRPDKQPEICIGDHLHIGHPRYRNRLLP